MQFNTNHPDRREGLLKADLKDLEDGESVFHNSVHDYYQDRPKTTNKDDTDWENMTLAEFVSQYTIYKNKPASKYASNLRQLA